MHAIQYTYTAPEYASSYRDAVDTVARERKYLLMTEGFSLEKTTDFMKRIIDAGAPQYFALDGERIIGWCDIVPRAIPEFSYTGALGIGVLAAYRGRGIGRELISLCIEHARAKTDLEKIELDVYATNTAAQNLYRRAGFIVEGERVNARKIDGAYDNMILMGMILR